MADRLLIELVGEAQLLRRLDDAAQQLETPFELFDAIGALMKQNVEARFDDKVDPSGVPWAPIAPSTAALYRRANQGSIPGTLLDRSNVGLRSSLGFNSGADFVEVGFNRPTDGGGAWEVGTLHEFGTARMPRRGLLSADPQAGELGAGDRDDILAEIDHFVGGLL